MSDLKRRACSYDSRTVAGPISVASVEVATLAENSARTPEPAATAGSDQVASFLRTLAGESE